MKLRININTHIIYSVESLRNKYVKLITYNTMVIKYMTILTFVCSYINCLIRIVSNSKSVESVSIYSIVYSINTDKNVCTKAFFHNRYSILCSVFNHARISSIGHVKQSKPHFFIFINVGFLPFDFSYCI